MENKIGKNIAILAKVEGWTQDKLAKSCNISRISLNRFFRGHTELRAGDFVNLLKCLNIDLNHLLNDRFSQTIRGEHIPFENKYVPGP